MAGLDLGTWITPGPAYVRGPDGKVQLQNWVTKKVVLDGMDLSRADLRFAVLEGASLKGSQLQEARLQRADLSQADLRNSDLRGADLREAVLRATLLAGARFNARTQLPFSSQEAVERHRMIFVP